METVCVVCGDAEAEVGCLCGTCAKEVLPGEALIPEHLDSTVSRLDAEAWLVDGFGQTHALAPRSLIGRRPSSRPDFISVLSPSVSREHAELRQSAAGWTLRDTGSRNGTCVDGVKLSTRVTLANRSLVTFGDVRMWFLSEVTEELAPASTLETTDLRTVIDYRLIPASGPELRFLGTAEGGSIKQRRDHGWGDDRDLPLLEFQLLRALCARAHSEADSEEVARGCVSTKRLVDELSFKSRYPNADNVRQVVFRLQRTFAELGVPDIVDVRPGRGYFMTCHVEVMPE